MNALIVSNSATLAFGMPGSTEWIILLVLGLLIFGRRLPEVGRSLGRGIVEFKKGIRGIEDEIDDATDPKLAGKSASGQIGDTAAPSASVSQASAGSEGPNPYASVESEKPQGQG